MAMKGIFKIGTSPITNQIHAGLVKNGQWQGTKHDVTDSAPAAVAQHLLQTGEAIEFMYMGEQYRLSVEKINNPKP
jgi:hypothetical protein